MKKVQMNRLDFCKNPQNLIFGRYLELKKTSDESILLYCIANRRMDGQSQIYMALLLIRVSNNWHAGIRKKTLKHARNHFTMLSLV